MHLRAGRANFFFKVRFFITVKKNYRAVAYHNWSHGFHVANSVYSILKASPGIFKPIEVAFTSEAYLSLIHSLSHSLSLYF